MKMLKKNGYNVYFSETRDPFSIHFGRDESLAKFSYVEASLRRSFDVNFCLK